MSPFSLKLVLAFGALCVFVMACDAFSVARTALALRRRRRRGSYGVVIGFDGRIIGTYLDPFAPNRRGVRVHRGESPWTEGRPPGEAWAWEGFGSTPEEAERASKRVRRRYLRLLPGLSDAPEGWRG